ncbi:hypothetical protein QVD17_27345 [Tagetes erecta]|uniref:Uncharacterized protein n=1 Tax=Tagetes erecta TaxID=13708 RepID=A0AAD8NR69_TARER|nr:hypothetical protein QVD17_27345 [Tagetes erecta]
MWTSFGVCGRRCRVRGKLELVSSCSRGTHRLQQGGDEDLPRRLARDDFVLPKVVALPYPPPQPPPRHGSSQSPEFSSQQKSTFSSLFPDLFQPTSDNILEKIIFVYHKPPTATTPTVARPHSHHRRLLFILLSLFYFALTLSLFTTQTTTTATPTIVKHPYTPSSSTPSSES